MRSGHYLVLLASFAAAGAACVGDIGDGVGEGPSSDPLTCEEVPIAGPSPIRRMTRFEYDQTVRDLLGDTTSPASGFGAEEEGFGFNNNAAMLLTSQTLVEQYMLAAEDVSLRATEPVTKNLPCDPATGEEACAVQFIEAFGKRAFRRPLTDAERAMFLNQYQLGRTDEDFRLGIRRVIETALQSPAFLYRVEMGIPEETSEGVMPLTSWEMASRLSYFLWGTMPDDELFAAAEADGLRTPEAVEAQARRMLEHENARPLVAEFHRQWLDYERVANITKDGTLYPDWSTTIGDLMAEETKAFIEHAIFDTTADGKSGSLATLLGAAVTYVNQDLATFYGIEGVTGSELQRVDLDPTQHAGILTTGTLLAINSHTNQTSPVLRGKLIRELILCDALMAPPPDVNTQAPEIAPGSTGKDRFAQHSVDPACAPCHQMMDPIGFGFENYDTVGRYRDSEAGKPIDATGALVASDVDGPFDGVAQLAQKLTASDEVAVCYATQWFRYGYGRKETPGDACTVEDLGLKFKASGNNVKELLVALTQTDAFLLRQAGGVQ